LINDGLNDKALTRAELVFENDWSLNPQNHPMLLLPRLATSAKIRWRPMRLLWQTDDEVELMNATPVLWLKRALTPIPC